MAGPSAGSTFVLPARASPDHRFEFQGREGLRATGALRSVCVWGRGGLKSVS